MARPECCQQMSKQRHTSPLGWPRDAMGSSTLDSHLCGALNFYSSGWIYPLLLPITAPLLVPLHHFTHHSGCAGISLQGAKAHAQCRTRILQSNKPGLIRRQLVRRAEQYRPSIYITTQDADEIV